MNFCLGRNQPKPWVGINRRLQYFRHLEDYSWVEIDRRENVIYPVVPMD